MLIIIGGRSSKPELEHLLEIFKTQALESKEWKLEFLSYDAVKW